jgi:anti-sigma factor RsiW
MDVLRLAAYVDGALEPEDAAAVVIHLADNAADRRRVAQLTELNGLLAAAYAGPLSEPMPDRIRQAVAPSNVVPLRPRARVLPVALAGVLLAAAASVAVVVGISGNQGFVDIGAPGVGPVAVGSELHVALEESGSGSVVRFPDGDEVTLIATFRNGRGRPCREFELLHDSATEVSRGIACRGGEAGWAVAMIVSEPIGGEVSSDPGYMPAGGAIDAALSGALDVLGAGPSLAPATESALIASGWTGE